MRNKGYSAEHSHGTLQAKGTEMEGETTTSSLILLGGGAKRKCPHVRDVGEALETA
jgi:hypothetical protein